MWALSLLLSGLGLIPLPEVVQRFPDASAFPGVGTQKEANMLEAITREGGEELLTRGPGPGQIMARFRQGLLSPQERVAVLLTACHYHDLQLLPLYQWAFAQGGTREKVAALVGYFQLLGLDPPAPSSIPPTGPHWQELAQRAGEVAEEARKTPLVRLWLRSYLAATGLVEPQGLVFKAKPEDCLRALLRLAQPEDLAEVVAFWPLVREKDRSYLVRLLEALTLARWVPAPPNPQGPTGPWIMETAVNSVDAWVANLCASPDGWATFWRRAQELGSGDPRQGLLLVLRQPYPPAWPLAAWYLQAWGAPAVLLERSRPEHPVNEEQVRRLRALFLGEGGSPSSPRPPGGPKTPPFPPLPPKGGG